MIAPDTILFIYEVRAEFPDDPSEPPSSYLGLWNEDDFAYLFFTQPEDAFVRGLVAPDQSELVARHELAYKDWQTGLPSEGLTGGGLLFVPADHPSPPANAILLDPGVVFGDGNHATTLACLQLLAEMVEGISPRRVLDLGTGTGILSLAAMALGAESVVAVDCIRLAARTAHYNVHLNRAETTISVVLGQARHFLDIPYDLVLANLPFHVLRDLAVRGDAPLHRAWIVSGINAPQAELLQELFAEHGYVVGSVLADSPWTTFSLLLAE
jgi:ribosomal protein L11 methyltransferase